MVLLENVMDLPGVEYLEWHFMIVTFYQSLKDGDNLRIFDRKEVERL